MEWRFRISGAYLWGDAEEGASLKAPSQQTSDVDTNNGATARQGTPGGQGDRDATELREAATPTSSPGHLQAPSNRIDTDTGEQAVLDGARVAVHGAPAKAGLDWVLSGEALPKHLLSRAGGLEVENAAAAGVMTPTLPGNEREGLAADRGDVQKIEGLSLQIASLLREAGLKDARLERLESDLQTKCSENLRVQQQVTLLLDKAKAKDVGLGELESTVCANCGRHAEAQQQTPSLLDDARVKNKRVEELESALDAKCSEHSQAQNQISSLLDDATAKSKRVEELESTLETKCSEHLKAQTQISLLLDDAKAKGKRVEELEFTLETECSEHLKAQTQISLLLDDAKAKSKRVEELESTLDAECSEHSKAQQQIVLLLEEARKNVVTVESLESRLASEHSERLTVQQLYASLRKTIRVMVRIRPPVAGAKDDGAAGWSTGSESATLEIAASATQSKGLKYRFDRVFRPQASNHDVFDETLPLVRLAATEGARCVIMAYGASSTGKSYTMRGDKKASPPTPGIIQLAGCRIFDMISSDGTVEVSSMYAYNGQVWDLLVAQKDKNLDIPATHKACTPDTRYEHVRSAEELVEYFDSTMSKTVKSATRLNAESSRGHYFFTVRVGGQPGDAGTGLLTFVDLAGNESVKESGVEGEQFEESKSINSDLFALGEMIRNLRLGLTADTKRSKLTQLLAGAMGLGTNVTARSEILMLATVNLSGNHMPKGIRTLDLAQKAIGTSAKKAK